MVSFLRFLVALLLVSLLLLPSIFIYIFCSIDTKQNGIFTQQRIGKNGKLFTLLKFRTISSVGIHTTVTHQNMNISRWGMWIRKYAIDEWPQLINILKGDMHFIGIRPDTPEYFHYTSEEDRIIFTIPPGITGYAQLKLYQEEKELFYKENPTEYYKNVLWPKKVELNKKYLTKQSFGFDCKILYYSILMLVFSIHPPKNL